jgi:hypothetical protein
VIQDLEGATSEPSRRRHVAMLSAAAAAVSLVLLMALVAPTPRMDRPIAASAARSTGDSPYVSSPSDPMWLASDRGGPFEESMRDDGTWTECAAGIGSSPAVTLVFDREGRRLVAAYTTGPTGRFIALPKAYVDSGWVTVPCDASDVFAPRINRAR